MALSTCPKPGCNSKSFEVKDLEVQRSAFQLKAIQCSVCGAVVSVVEYNNISALLIKLADKMGFKL